MVFSRQIIFNAASPDSFQNSKTFQNFGIHTQNLLKKHL